MGNIHQSLLAKHNFVRDEKCFHCVFTTRAQEQMQSQHLCSACKDQTDFIITSQHERWCNFRLGKNFPFKGASLQVFIDLCNVHFRRISQTIKTRTHFFHCLQRNFGRRFEAVFLFLVPTRIIPAARWRRPVTSFVCTRRERDIPSPIPLNQTFPKKTSASAFNGNSTSGAIFVLCCVVCMWCAHSHVHECEHGGSRQCRGRRACVHL